MGLHMRKNGLWVHFCPSYFEQKIIFKCRVKRKGSKKEYFNKLIFLIKSTITMGRIQSKGKGKGISSTVTPFKRRCARWVAHTPRSIS